MTTSQNAEVEYHYVILVSGTLKELFTYVPRSTYVAYIHVQYIYIIDYYKIIHRDDEDYNLQFCTI